MDAPRSGVLVAVLANPPLTTGTRTIRRVELAAELLGFSRAAVANLFALPSRATGEITEFGAGPEGWMSARSQLAAQIDAWATDLVAGICPEPVREQLYRILFRPDRNAPEYKAVVEAANRSHRAPLDLLKAAGAIDSPNKDKGG